VDSGIPSKRRHLLRILLSVSFLHSGLLFTQAVSQNIGLNTLDYTELALDLMLDKLPPQYMGHDPEKLFNILKQQQKTSKKGEFETTEEFHSRIQKQREAPILGDLTIGSTFIFQIPRTTGTPYTLGTYNIKAAYDADHKVLEVAALLDTYYLDKKIKYFSSREIYDPKKHYEGTNAFGTQVTVEVHHSKHFKVIINNYQSFPLIKYISKENRDLGLKDSSYALDAYVVRLNMDNSSARIAKENLSLLVVCKIIPPFTTEDTFSDKATILSPIESSRKDSYIYTNVLELWFYNISTGEIYAKLRRSSQSSTTRGSSRPRGSK
jgi:hypothetical protein